MLSSNQNLQFKTFFGLLITFILFVGCLTGPKLLVSIGHLNMSAATTFFISRLLFWTLLLIVYFYCVKIENQSLLLWREQNYGVMFYLISVVLLLISVLAGGILINQLVIVLKLNHHSSALTKLTQLSIALKLFAIVTAAIVEELIFRGYLIPRLQLYFKNSAVTVIISAIIFGVAHLSYGTLSNVLVPIFVGLVFGYHYQKYRNLKVLIICHALIDFYALILQH